MFQKQLSTAIIFTFVLMLGSLSAEAASDVSRTWNKAEIWIKTDDGFFSSHMDDAILRDRLNAAGKQYPTVLFFHDCGKNRKQAGWHYARFMARAGFAVILPDSFARSDRPETCEYWQFKPLAGAPAKKVHALRMEEISHALARIPSLSWVDPENLFLMGHGEGGDALGAFKPGGYMVRVLSGALCQWGLEGPIDMPTLSVASRNDRLFNGKRADSCKLLAKGRSFRNILFDGEQHDTSSLPDARKEVIRFLKTFVE